MVSSQRLRGRGLLVDLDNTLYAYGPAHEAALARVLPEIARVIGEDLETTRVAWDSARETVKARVGNTAAAHARRAYASELLYARKKSSALAQVREWENAYWASFLDAAQLRDGAIDLLRGFREHGGKVAIVTDLTLDVQLHKLERFALFSHVDALAASEEVRADKPALDVFRLALARIDLPASACVVVGDSDERDGGGARALGVPFFQVTGDASLREIARKIGAE
jgi:putative hydrolase of the HAD superfamily